jgi:type IV fimbrial biogenesis protein FimT
VDVSLKPRVQCADNIAFGSRHFRSRRDVRDCAGYTLHETLITLVITGLLAVGAVAFARLLESTQISAHTNALIGDLSFARIEALKRSQPITLCKSSSGAGCTQTSAWHQGWIIFVDGNENGQLDDDDGVIRITQALAGGVTLKFSAWGPGTGKYVNYTAIGTTRQNGTFTFCSAQSLAARAVILIQTGRARASTKNSAGGALTCP